MAIPKGQNMVSQTINFSVCWKNRYFCRPFNAIILNQSKKYQSWEEETKERPKARSAGGLMARAATRKRTVPHNLRHRLKKKLRKTVKKPLGCCLSLLPRAAAAQCISCQQYENPHPRQFAPAPALSVGGGQVPRNRASDGWHQLRCNAACGAHLQT